MHADGRKGRAIVNELTRLRGGTQLGSDERGIERLPRHEDHRSGETRRRKLRQERQRAIARAQPLFAPARHAQSELMTPVVRLQHRGAAQHGARLLALAERREDEAQRRPRLAQRLIELAGTLGMGPGLIEQVTRRHIRRARGLVLQEARVGESGVSRRIARHRDHGLLEGADRFGKPSLIERLQCEPATHHLAEWVLFFVHRRGRRGDEPVAATGSRLDVARRPRPRRRGPCGCRRSRASTCCRSREHRARSARGERPW